jgi:hypothetical protein
VKGKEGGKVMARIIKSTFRNPKLNHALSNPERTPAPAVGQSWH